VTWQAITSSNSEQAYYRDLLAQLVQIATSSHIASVDNIDSGGTGYSVGDILTYSHASGIHDASFEVTAESSGVITELRIVNGGSFGRRVTSPSVNSGGSGYPASSTVIVEIDEGHSSVTDFRQRCKLEATTNGSGVVTAVSLFEGGGNYEGGTDPSTTAATTTVIDGQTGSGLTVDLSLQAITGASNLVLSGGGGGTVQIDVTLAATGWYALRDDHDYTTPHGETDEKQVVLQGTVADGDAPIVGFVSYFEESGVDDYYGLLLLVMDTYNDGLALENQIGANSASDTISSSSGSYVPSFNAAESCWLSMNARKIAGVNKTVGTSVNAYHQFYLGLMDPFGTATESPYPMFMGGSVNGSRVWTNNSTDSIDVSGLTELFNHSGRNGPFYYRRVADGAYPGCRNAQGTGFPLTIAQDRVMFPIGQPRQAQASDQDYIGHEGSIVWYNSITKNNGQTATLVLKPAPGTDEHQLYPAVLTLQVTTGNPIEWGPAGRLSNVYWVSGTKTDGSTIAAEDTITDPNDPTIVYRVFPNGIRTEPYSFMAMREA